MDAMLRLAQVKILTGYATSTIYKKMKENTFPKQVPLGPNSVGWLEHEIGQWRMEKIEKRNSATSR